MAIGTAATVVSIAATAAGTGMSFAQANKQKKLQQQAETEAAKSMVEAKKALSVNYMESLSIPTQAYEMEKDILSAASAQATEAGREGDQRGVAATAGRVQAATTEGARGIRADMAGELYNLDKLTQEENKNIAENLAGLNLAEAQGAQLAARDAQEARSAAITQGFAGVAKLGGQLMAAAPLYEKSQQAKALSGITTNYEKAVQSGKVGADFLNADGTPMTTQQALVKAGGLGADVAKLTPVEFQDYLTKMPLSQLEALYQDVSFGTSNMGGVNAVNPMTSAEVQAAMFQNTNRPDVRSKTNYDIVSGNQGASVNGINIDPFKLY
jgi:hypothetical protein